ncbi:efflux RND transporter periplasmic adaptor subunit [Candidatus Shapirobacteria bacterium]|nr:efflux RND transporter periplasmic adaptor subunit [Candidatus Shapirobacteria bacterium]
MKKKLIIFFIISFSLLTAGVIFRFPLRAQEVATGKVERKNLTEKLTVSGEVNAEEKASLKFQTSGLLSWVGVKEGEWVKKGQAIASLDQRELKKRLEKELNDYMTVRWNFEQTHDDYKEYKDNATLTDEMKRILEKAQFGLSNAVIDVELADLALKYATIATPIAGIVTNIDTPLAGVNITPATATFDIVNPNSVYFEARIDELEIGKVKEGQKVIITLDSYPDKTFEGLISAIDFAASTVGGSKVFLTKISLPENSDRQFRLGMGGDAEIILNEKENVLTIPAEALIKRERNFVWTVDNEGKARKKEVETGLSTDEEIEIISGLEEGAEIVTKGIMGLKEGQKIR